MSKGLNLESHQKDDTITLKIFEAFHEVSMKNANPNGEGPLDAILNDQSKMDTIINDFLLGQYKPKPYKLKLLLKSRGKPPREMAIPSFLDQALLKSLDRIFKLYVKITNQTPLAYFIIKDLKTFLPSISSEHRVMRVDIKGYFDSINHQKLIEKIGKKECPPWLVSLVQRFIENPSKETGKKTPQSNVKGIPQGISIASYLADLYLEDLDKKLKEICSKSYRY